MKIKTYIGLDLGTSSLKLLAVKGKDRQLVRIPYQPKKAIDFYQAICLGFKKLDACFKDDSLERIAIDSQVGTYVLEDSSLLPWSSPVGEKEAEELLKKIPQQEFIQEIGMPHPHLSSYPLPRLFYLKSKGLLPSSLMMPKEYVLKQMTGRYVSDPYSYRGLAKGKKFAAFLLEKLGIEIKLPELLYPWEEVSTLLPKVKEELKIQGNPMVLCGWNDFYSGLVGLGIKKEEDIFDLGGTSSHVGILIEEPCYEDKLVYSPFLLHSVLYGGTASTGPSLNLALNLADKSEGRPIDYLSHHPPIFLPYLKGERAPVYDLEAKGEFFGVEANCTKEDLSYSILEGIAFSLYSISLLFPKKGKRILSSGGMSGNTLLNQLKADIFSLPLYPLKDKESTVLGSYLLAKYQKDCLKEGKKEIEYLPSYQPDEEETKILRERFSLYQQLYPRLKDLYHKKGEMNL